MRLVPEALWKLTIQKNQWELHFWWMNHLKIPWHSSHDLFWRQINSLPKVAFYFMFKKPSQPRYMRNSKSCWDLSQCEKGRKDGATESHFQERSDLQTWALKGSEPKRMPKIWGHSPLPWKWKWLLRGHFPSVSCFILNKSNLYIGSPTHLTLYCYL